MTPLTLSIETQGGVATPNNERNTKNPTNKSQIFSTALTIRAGRDPRRDRVSVRWLRTNNTLGKFILDGIPPAPRGVPQIEVTF